MRQVVQNLKGEVRLLELPIPAIREGGVLVRTVHSLVSAGTERMNVERSRRSLLARARERPDLVRQVIARMKRDGITAAMRGVQDKLESWIPMGYSSAGIVEAVGAGVTGLRVGDAVACAGAGYASHAEVTWVPQNLCARVPSGPDGAARVPLEDAAWSTLGAIALQGVRQLEPRLGECVAVIGLGLLGLLSVQLLRANGCEVLAADPDPARCRLAEELGAREATAPGAAFAAAVERRTGGRGADGVLITAATESRDPIVHAGQVARERARVVIVGAVPVDVPRSPYYEKELEVRFSRSYGPGRYDPRYEEGGQDYPIGYVRWTEQRNLEGFLDLLASGGVKVGPLVTHRFGIAEATQAYELLTGRREPCLGIVLDYPDPPARHTRVPAAAVGIGSGELGVGLIGPGSFARSTLLPAVQAVPGVRLRGVAAATGLTVASVTERHGFAFGTTAADEVLADADTHAVIIATRHHLHAGQVIAALRAGKHVYVEKPLCIREEELEPILAAAAAAPDRLLMVGFNRRFAPLVRRLEALMGRRSGPVQLHYRINAGRVPPQSWVHDPEVGGGRIIGECCHFLDLAAAIIGQPALRISATASAADSIAALASYPDGSAATVEYFSFGHPAVPKERLEVVCDGGIYRLDDFRSLSWDAPAGKGSETGGTQDKGHRNSVAAFLAAVRGGGPAPVGLADQIASMRTTFRAIEAAATGSGLSITPSGAGTAGDSGAGA